MARWLAIVFVAAVLLLDLSVAQKLQFQYKRPHTISLVFRRMES